jgi:glycosyltransferase involved in cell wall biosynthesis
MTSSPERSCRPQMRALVLSHVMPIGGTSGQQQRVYYSLRALREHFHVIFVGLAPSAQHSSLRRDLADLCDEVQLLPGHASSGMAALRHRGLAWLYQRRTGLKRSNYFIGKLGFSPARIASLLAGRQINLALFEYFHAADSAPVLQQQGIPCVLDMHNILWQSFARQLDARGVAGKAKERAIGRYRAAEESSWRRFDGLIAISEGERDYVQPRLRPGQRLFYAPMGLPLSDWPYCWSPAEPARVAYYGNMGSAHNADDARRCHQAIMPLVWNRLPRAEMWFVGSKPPQNLLALTGGDPRVKVTGFVDRVQDLLKTISVLLCPFTGTYGFRSRIIEAMALGVPVVATPDAVFGMGLQNERGLFLADSDESLAAAALRLLQSSGFARQHSLLARDQVESQFSFQASYMRLASELSGFVSDRRSAAACRSVATPSTVSVEPK